MGERKEIKITTVEAKRQMDIIAQLSQHIKDKNLKFCISTFGWPWVCVNTIKLHMLVTYKQSLEWLCKNIELSIRIVYIKDE